MDRKDGGPVFPGTIISESGYNVGHSMGMSLRDYAAIKFAAKAYIAGTDYGMVAKEAYKMADAMLAEREDG